MNGIPVSLTEIEKKNAVMVFFVVKQAEIYGLFKKENVGRFDGTMTVEEKNR